MKGSCLCWNMYVSLRERSMSSKSLVMSVSGWCGVGMYSSPFWRIVCCSRVRGWEERLTIWFESFSLASLCMYVGFFLLLVLVLSGG